MRTFGLVSLNLRWLGHNPWRNPLVSPNFTFFTLPKFSSPFLQPPPACPTPSSPSDPRLPPQRPPVPSSPHSHNAAHQEFTNLQPTLMIP
ncbi:hypothetical protein O181_035100 [Austropuccinia psidii MF-1]|uniref:Uncharacterized protein n=1 Tax=Austropuccinia psidii MF-1 TaxID=1389203 RepID=A0A9Q3HAV7_9BASI|nr:hypothetical protein [Austropuccinia psidii MF-1]